MQRRMLSTAALSAAMFPLIAAAQAPSGSGQTVISQSDSALRMQALAASAFSLATSRLAMSRASAAQLREFAQFEAEEQEAVIEALRLIGLAVPAQVPLDQQKTQMMSQLQSAQGAAFDRAYLTGQQQGHEELERLHTAIAASGAAAPERVISMVAVPAIKTHLGWLRMMREQR